MFSNSGGKTASSRSSAPRKKSSTSRFNGIKLITPMRKIKNATALLPILLLGTLFSCSTPYGDHPQDIDHSPAMEPGIERITILGTNDIHGAIVPLELKTREKGDAEPEKYEAGGLAYLASYVKI